MTVPEGFVQFWIFGKDVLWMSREKFDQWKAFYGLERFPLYRVTERRTAGDHDLPHFGGLRVGSSAPEDARADSCEGGALLRASELRHDFKG